MANKAGCGANQEQPTPAHQAACTKNAAVEANRKPTGVPGMQPAGEPFPLRLGHGFLQQRRPRRPLATDPEPGQEPEDAEAEHAGCKPAEGR